MQPAAVAWKIRLYSVELSFTALIKRPQFPAKRGRVCTKCVSVSVSTICLFVLLVHQHNNVTVWFCFSVDVGKSFQQQREAMKQTIEEDKEPEKSGQF